MCPCFMQNTTQCIKFLSIAFLKLLLMFVDLFGYLHTFVGRHFLWSFPERKYFFGLKSMVINQWTDQQKQFNKKKAVFKEDGFRRPQPSNSAWWRKWRREGTEDRQQSLAYPERAGEIVHVPACHMVSRQAAEQDRWMKTWTQKHHKKSNRTHKFITTNWYLF